MGQHSCIPRFRCDKFIWRIMIRVWVITIWLLFIQTNSGSAYNFQKPFQMVAHTQAVIQKYHFHFHFPGPIVIFQITTQSRERRLTAGWWQPFKSQHKWVRRKLPAGKRTPHQEQWRIRKWKEVEKAAPADKSPNLWRMTRITGPR